MSTVRKTLTLMTEEGVDVPVWRMPADVGLVSPEELRDIGVSAPLVDRLKAWARDCDAPYLSRLRLDDLREGGQVSLRLARQLQAELPDYEIFIMQDGSPRPLHYWS